MWFYFPNWKIAKHIWLLLVYDILSIIYLQTRRYCASCFTWYAINIFNYLFSFQGSGLDGWKVQCIELDLVSFKSETIVTNTHLICFLLYISTNYHRRKINAPIRTKLLILRQVKHFVGCISLLHIIATFQLEICIQLLYLL